MGLPWIELHTNLPRHPKSVALGFALANPMAWAHMAHLWLWCAENLVSGIFRGEHAEAMVESSANWMGKPGEFVTAALKVGFLERAENGEIISRGWQKRAAPHLEKRAKDSARQRERYQKMSPSLQKTSRGEHAEKSRRKRGPHAENSGDIDSDKDSYLKKPLSLARPEVASVFEHWRDVMGKGARTVLDASRQKSIERGLGLGFSVDELKRAVTGCSKTPHNIGQNERNQRYDGLHIVCRDADTIERFMANAGAREASGEPALKRLY